MEGKPPPGEGRRDNVVKISPELLPRLVEACDPVIARVLARYFRRRASGGSAAALDEEDLRAAARLQIIERLQARGPGPIDDLPAYAARVAHVAWAEHCRARVPERRRFLDQVRYVVENDQCDDPVTRWDDEDGVAVCGFSHWRGRRARLKGELPASVVGQVLEVVARRHARAAVRQLLRLVAVPIAWRDLQDFLGGMLEQVASPTAGEIAPAATPSLHGEIFHRENLRWLWGELATLPRRQCVAFLLHAAVAKEFEYEGVASIREIAELLEIPAEQVAQWWFRIPLDDHTIAAELGATRQEVINLRKAARGVLGKRLAVFLEVNASK